MRHKTKNYIFPKIKVTFRDNGFAKGLVLKRQLTLRECKHILINILGIDIQGRDCFEFSEDYKDYNDEIVANVNAWLIGDAEDEAIAQYAYDCSDEQLGLINMIPIVDYLIKKGII